MLSTRQGASVDSTDTEQDGVRPWDAIETFLWNALTVVCVLFCAGVIGLGLFTFWRVVVELL